MASQTTPDSMRSPLGTLIGVLPLALGQAYLIWLIATERITFFEVVLMSVLEVIITVEAAIVFVSPSAEIRSRRLREQNGLIFMLLFMLYLSLTVTTLTQRHYHDVPAGMIPEMTAVIVGSLTGPTFLRGGIYLLITVGLPVVVARRHADQLRSWYMHQFMPASMSFVAMFATAFLGIFPTIMQAQDYPTRLGAIVSVELTVLLGIFRVLIAILFIRKMTATEFEQMYAKFLAGDDKVDPKVR